MEQLCVLGSVEEGLRLTCIAEIAMLSFIGTKGFNGEWKVLERWL